MTTVSANPLPLALVEKLVEWLVDDPRKLAVNASVMGNRVHWMVDVDANDFGKALGKQGAHAKSLSVLLKLMGARRDEAWRLILQDPARSPLRDKVDAPDAAGYNPREAEEFLREIFFELLSGAPALTVTSEGGSPPAFKFKIEPATRQDYGVLADPVQVAKAKPEEGKPEETMNAIAALGTLFRAYGRQRGVSFRIEVPGE